MQFLEGNSSLVEKFYQRVLEKDKLKIAFFGDHYYSDVYASACCSSQNSCKWAAFAVIEELGLYDRAQLDMGTNPDYVATDDYWGASYFTDECNGKTEKNYFVSGVEDDAKYALPFVANIVNWL
jgi:hypothetical protein